MKLTPGELPQLVQFPFSILERIDVGETEFRALCGAWVDKLTFSILERIDVGETMKLASLFGSR